MRIFILIIILWFVFISNIFNIKDTRVNTMSKERYDDRPGVSVYKDKSIHGVADLIGREVARYKQLKCLDSDDKCKAEKIKLRIKIKMVKKSFNIKD